MSDTPPYVGPVLTGHDLEAIRGIIRSELDAQFARFFAAAERATMQTPDEKRCKSCGGVCIDTICVDCGM